MREAGIQTGSCTVVQKSMTEADGKHFAANDVHYIYDVQKARKGLLEKCTRALKNPCISVLGSY